MGAKKCIFCYFFQIIDAQSFMHDFEIKLLKKNNVSVKTKLILL